jgi:hypothetical protein
LPDIFHLSIVGAAWFATLQVRGNKASFPFAEFTILVCSKHFLDLAAISIGFQCLRILIKMSTYLNDSFVKTLRLFFYFFMHLYIST